MAVDQKDIALGGACSPYILILHCLTITINNYGSKPHLSIMHINFMHNTQQFFNSLLIFMFVHCSSYCDKNTCSYMHSCMLRINCYCNLHIFDHNLISVLLVAVLFAKPLFARRLFLLA